MKWILKMGAAPPEVVAEHGDYQDWFARGCGWREGSYDVIDVPSGDSLPDVSQVSSVIMSGSSSMVTDHAEWSVRAGKWLRRIVSADRWVLGVCYGHQLLAEHLEGGVARNPAGREIGTIEVNLHEASAEDPLFSSLPRRLRVQATHRESVLDLPPNSTLLGGSPLDPHQAFRAGRRAWGVQFHPEMTAAVMRHYVERRADACREEGLDPEAIHRAVVESPHGQRLLRRFAELADS